MVQEKEEEKGTRVREMKARVGIHLQKRSKIEFQVDSRCRNSLRLLPGDGQISIVMLIKPKLIS